MQFKNQLNHTNLFLIFSTHSGWNIISLIDMFWDKSRDQYLKILSMCFLGEDLRHFLCWKLTSVWPKLAEKMFYNFLNNLSCRTAAAASMDQQHLKASRLPTCSAVLCRELMQYAAYYCCSYREENNIWRYFGRICCLEKSKYWTAMFVILWHY